MVEWYKNNPDKHKAYVKQRAQEIRKWFLEIRNTLACEICGENHPACLDFHHENPEKKLMTVSRMVQNGWSKTKILEEIAKCRVLCSNCHRKFHWADDAE